MQLRCSSCLLPLTLTLPCPLRISAAPLRITAAPLRITAAPLRISAPRPASQVDRALSLLSQMKAEGVERNVHTYSALMNVCIKCGQLQLSLEVYQQMLQVRALRGWLGCLPLLWTALWAVLPAAAGSAVL